MLFRHSDSCACYFPDLLQCESDSLGEDIMGTETEESSEYDSEDGYADGFIDDSDIDMYPSSPVPNSGGILIILLNFLEAITCLCIGSALFLCIF